MNLCHLKYFQDAAAASSVSKAAEMNFVSQSAVSHAIRSLEENLGVELITHKKRFELTRAGQLLIAESERLLDGFNGLKDRLKQGAVQVQSRLHFACSHSVALNLVPAALKAFRKEFPHAVVTSQLGNSDLVKEWVATGAVDFGVVVDDGGLANFRTETLFSGNFIMIGSKGSKSSLEESGLIVTRKKKREVELWSSRYKRLNRREIPIRMEVLSWEVIKTLVLAGEGYGLIPDYLSGGDSVVTHSTKFPPVTYKLCAIQSKSKTPSREAKAFLRQMSREQ